MLVSDVAEKVQAAPTQPGLLHSSSLPSRLHEENPYLIWRGGHSSINISLYATANFRKEERKKNAETWISTFPYSRSTLVEQPKYCNSISRVRKLHALHSSRYISPARFLLSTKSYSSDSVLSSALGLRLRLHEKPSLAPTR